MCNILSATGVYALCMQCVFIYNGLNSFLKEYIFLFLSPFNYYWNINYIYDRTAPKLKQLHVNTKDYIEDAQVINLEKVAQHFIEKNWQIILHSCSVMETFHSKCLIKCKKLLIWVNWELFLASGTSKKWSSYRAANSRM